MASRRPNHPAMASLRKAQSVWLRLSAQKRYAASASRPPQPTFRQADPPLGAARSIRLRPEQCQERSDENIPASERTKRLIMVATGNVSGGMAVDVLPAQPLEDPSQSWNALTIRGFTRKEQPPVPPPVMQAACRRTIAVRLAAVLSDFPMTLLRSNLRCCSRQAICFLTRPGFAVGTRRCPLSAGSDMAVEPLVPFWATSAAAGMAGHFIGQLIGPPRSWPETHRALT